MPKPCPGPVPAAAPTFKAPPGACDTHAHIIGPFDRFPLAGERGYTPPVSDLAAFDTFQKTLGIDRAVIVHPSCYSTMMDITVNAVTRMGDRARGIAVVEPSITDAELDRLNEAGFRGLRFTTLLKGGADVGGITAMAERIKRLGWHIQMFIDAQNQLEDLLPALSSLPVDLVIDHMGHFQPDAGVDHPAFQAMLDLVKDGRCWVKLSGAYRASNAGPDWADMTTYATALIETRADRMVWATDWPHVMLWDKPMPEGAGLLDWALSWNVDDTTMKQILVDNPAELYGF
jgi:predicted TIM-barrel fold metal-dependent hydrolase